MKAADIMVSNVITVGPSVSMREVANILLANRISGVPVVDEQGTLLGIVSEGDLIRRPESGTLRRHSSWADMLMSNRTLAIEYIKSHSRKVVDIMTQEVITATSETPLEEIATLFELHRIKRVPIVKNGKVVGIVTRANILQALVSSTNKVEPVSNVRDSEIRKKVIGRLNAEPWRPSMLDVTVHEGAVDVWGMVSSEEEKKAACIAIEVIPGVQGVNNHLMIPPIGYGMM